ncbi:MAG: selenium metabolism-associated LysR family transcriptional regulator [bacterium]
MAIDIHHFEVFCKCAELGNFSEAAKALEIKQSTISTHIKSMESEVGVDLFDRRKGRIYLTPAGEILYRRGLDVIASRRRAMEAVHNFLGKIEGVLHLGGSTLPAAYILPKIMSGFRKIYPQVTFHLVTGNTAGILNHISLEKIEVGAAGSLPDEQAYASCIMEVDELLLAFSPAHFSVLGESVTVEELKSLPLIVREKGSGTRQLVEKVLAQAGLSLSELQIVAEMGGLEVVKRAVLSGIGVSFISKVALEFEIKAGLLKAAPLSHWPCTRNFYLVRLLDRTLSPTALAFWDYARHVRHGSMDV